MFVVIEVGARPVPVLSVTTHLDRARTIRQAPNLLTDLNQRAGRFRSLTRDRTGPFTEAFDAVLASAGIEAVTIPAQSQSERPCRTPGADSPG